MRPTVNRSERGRSGEAATLRVYRRRGYELIARNWRCPLGELDLVLRLGDRLIVCEVKTRTGAEFGGGYEAVTWSKRRTLRRLAEVFVQQHAVPTDEIRFDVASVWVGEGVPDVEIFEDAF